MKQWAVLIVIALLAGGCKTIPEDRYGVARLRLLGMEQLDPEALRACLATTERESLQLNFGTSTDLTCGEPPFDGGRLRLRLWRWPWEEWPTLDLAVFERDIERIERWFRARGFYDARVLSTELDPPSATTSDRVVGEGDEASCERDDDDEGCRVEIAIRVEEGEPILVSAVDIAMGEEVEGVTSEGLRGSIELTEGERFDEAFFDRSKQSIVNTLRDEGFACAEVTGHVDIDPDARRATVRFDVLPGPPSVFGDVTLNVAGEGDQNIPERTVLGAADIDSGATFSPRKIANAQRAVYALGAFSSVHVEAVPRRGSVVGTSAEGQAATQGVCEGIVDVRVDVTPGRALRYGVGGGIRSGILAETAGTTTTDVPQWDVHLLAFLEHRNLFGGLRRFRIEERPKLVFRAQFPDPVGNTAGNNYPPTLGNELRVEFRQPGFLEPRTTLSVTSRWDIGPDPNQPNIFRHDLDQGLVTSRPFFGGRLLLSNGFRVNLYRTAEKLNDFDDNLIASDYQVLFLEQYAQLDLRDDARQPRKGAFFSLGAQEAGLAYERLGVSSWRYFRLTPEARVYAPLPAGMVLAARFAVGAMMIQRHADDRDESDEVDNDLDEVSETLGPTRYRLRGGGPTSHRGYSSATLGWYDHEPGLGDDVPPDGMSPTDAQGNPLYVRTAGGLRRWEASVELRIPIDEDLGTVIFADMGDVNRKAAFRFNYIHLALGIGLRYQTIVGPLRLDFGVLIPGAQVVNGPERPGWADPEQDYADYWTKGRRIPGAINITIGEAY